MSEILIEDFDSNLFENNILSEGDSKIYKIVGPFIECNTKNRNKRIYPTPVVKPQVESYQKVIADNRAVGELNHPNTLEINPKLVAIKTEKLEFDGDDIVMGEAKICTTPNGMIVRNLIEDGIKLGVSTRGAGSLKNGIVQNDYRYIANDVVFDPSAPSCFVDGILEAKTEWVVENGLLVEREIKVIKSRLETMTLDEKLHLKEYLKSLFTDVINRAL